jgi:thiol peroxidase
MVEERVGEAFELGEQLTVVGHQSLSAHKDEAFGRDYGVLIKEWRLLQRAIFVLDRDGRIVHAEYVADQMAQPDYGAAVEAARRVASSPGR